MVAQLPAYLTPPFRGERFDAARLIGFYRPHTDGGGGGLFSGGAKTTWFMASSAVDWLHWKQTLSRVLFGGTQALDTIPAQTIKDVWSGVKLGRPIHQVVGRSRVFPLEQTVPIA